jgi:hypothetical protein
VTHENKSIPKRIQNFVRNKFFRILKAKGFFLFFLFFLAMEASKGGWFHGAARERERERERECKLKATANQISKKKRTFEACDGPFSKVMIHGGAVLYIHQPSAKEM